MGTRPHVEDIPFNFHGRQIRNPFSPNHRTSTGMKPVTDRQSKRQRELGFVAKGSGKDADAVARDSDGVEFRGQYLASTEARERTARTSERRY